MRSDTPSHTARIVARSLFLASKDPRLSVLLAPKAAEVLALIPEVSGGVFGTLAQWSWMRALVFGVESLALPGVIAHYLVRKLAIEARVREALAAGAERVVVIGAGFDTLVWRLHSEFPRVQWVEVDHPSTQAVKVRALGGASNVAFLSHDLVCPRPVSRLLEEAGFASGATVVIIEGVTMYLSEKKVGELLRDAAGLAGAGGRVLFTFMEKDARGSVDFRGQNPAVRWWLRFRSEPFFWGISRPDLEPFLSRCGLGNRGVIDHSGLRETHLEPQGLGAISLARGECLCICHPLP